MKDARTLSSPGFAVRAEASLRRRWAAASLVLPVALPLVFLHVDYQPGVTIGLGSTSASAHLSDLAVLGVGLAALVAGFHRGFGPLRAALPLWIAAAALLAMIFAATAYPALRHVGYPWPTHLVTAAKFAEYALLALALPLLLRGREDFHRLLLAVTLWSAVASAVALLQFAGAPILGAWPRGGRQPSFLGHHDLAALSGAALALALAAIAFGRLSSRERAVARAAGVSGGVGFVLSGALTGAVGLALAAAAAGLVAARRTGISRRRVLGLVALTGAVILGVVALRASPIDQFLRFLGLRAEQRTTREDVQSFAQRTMLAYIGVKILIDHPVVGIGWHGSDDEAGYGPYLAAAHARFPDQPPRAFPSPEHPWGVENGYVQALADMGAVGFGLLVALLGTGLALSARAALRAPPASAAPALVGLLWLLVVMGIWNGIGLIAGLPFDALLWLALGLGAVAAGSGRAGV